MNTTSRYDLAAPDWERKNGRLGYWRAYSGFLRDRVLRSGPIPDSGTGTGVFARAWVGADGSRDLTLLDPSQVMLDRARAGLEALGVTPAAVGARLEDFQPRLPCAAVLAAHVIEHCDDPEAAFRRFAGWLEPGGRLYLIASKPHWCNWLIWLRFRHRWFSESEVRRAAAAAGFCHDLTHVFDAGPPSRTSLGYIFSKP